MQPEQTVLEMVEEVLARQARELVEQTGQAFEAALEGVSETDAGRQLGALASGEHRNERAQEWQESLARKRAQERRYVSVEDYLERLEGKKICVRSTTRSWRNLLGSEGRNYRVVSVGR